MSPEYRTPGVYIEEIPPGVRSIAGVGTSVTAFLGRTLTGPTDAPSLVTSFRHFENVYGALSPDYPVGHAIQHYFANGGSRAVIARIAHRDSNGSGTDSAPITDADIADPVLATHQRGLWLLERAADVNIICIPPLSPSTDVGRATWDAAVGYARSRRAFVIIDAPSTWSNAADVAAGVDGLVTRDPHAALYFPRLLTPDPLNPDELRPFAPCGAVAGLYARTDAARGVWKAPAGTQATIRGAAGLTAALTDRDSGVLNDLGVNALRTFPDAGTVAWGARTLLGAAGLVSDWKYVPVRRLALFIEESLHQGTRWAVFERNDEPLWAQLRTSVGSFLHPLFLQGAFQGAAAREAYFVKCDSETTTPTDVANGVVNIVVGFAPLKPAEFVILRIAVRAAAVDTNV